MNSHLPPHKKTVVVGMSGGVDSSVTALLLKEQGYKVIGMFMKNWEDEEDGICPAAADFADVAAVCSQLKIPYYSVNFAKEYWDLVFSRCLEDFRAGYTPNPDILCNREIKFNIFFKKALELGGDFLATGHYCRNLEIDGENKLAKGLDPNKDQSYFLYTIKKEILSKVLFPIGEMHKVQIREIALKHDLITAKKKDSTGICFIGKQAKFKTFLNKYIAQNPGNFENLKGEVVGKHDGLSFYTIGQRKGLNIGGPGEAWYVLSKDSNRNVVIIDQGEDNAALHRLNLVATEITWVSGQPPKLPFRCCAKIRYRQEDAPCMVEKIDGDQIYVSFDRPQKAITPRQSIVFYDGDICLGGAIIAET